MNILKKPQKSKGWLGIAIMSAILTFLTTIAGVGGLTLRQLAKMQPAMTIEEAPVLPAIAMVDSATSTEPSCAGGSGGSSTPAPAAPTLKLFVASKRGKTYYYPWCTGATTIPQANKVWFSSRTAAEAAGYTPAKSCKDLSK